MSVSAPAVAPATADRVRDGDGVMESCTLILFGASGDLTQRMVMPAIFRLARRGFLSPEFRVIGYARSEMTDDEFRARMREAVMREASAGDEAAWSAFAARRAGPAYQPATAGWARFVIEKPFGHDLATARALNADIAHRFDENDIYRIDHFLGKEIVQNLFALRFANGIFEPVWNRNYIDHVQITAAETIGMEGRGIYYETAGAMRDMVQNHLLQLCALVAIEPPAEWNPRAVRDEKVKALRAVRRIAPGEVAQDAVRGQYGAGVVAGERVTEIVVEFRPAPHTPFSPGGPGRALVRPNRLVASIAPHERVVLQVQGKLPGQEMRLRSIDLDYCYTHDQGAAESLSAYEHLLLDALRGDPTFFARADEVEAAWEIVEPVIERWGAEWATDFPNYEAGSSGPSGADELPR